MVKIRNEMPLGRVAAGEVSENCVVGPNENSDGEIKAKQQMTFIDKLNQEKKNNNNNNKKIEQEEREEQPNLNEMKSKDCKDGSPPISKPNLELINEFRQLLSVAFEANSNLYSPIHYEEIMDESSPHVSWRYLIQRDECVHQALELAKEALAWRQKNHYDTLRPATMIKDYWLRAPIGFLGKSKSGNDLIYAIGKNFKKPDPLVKQTIRDFIIHMLMDWERQHRDDLSQFEVVFDVTDTGLRNIDLDFASWLVSIRDFVPARIKAIYFVGIPFVMRPIIRLIISWLPARFKNICHCGTYDQLVRANVDDECIPEEIGGRADNKWRLAPSESKWAHELDDPQANEIFKLTCEACSFNTSQEYLDKVYRMQEEHEKGLKQQRQHQ